MNDEAEAPSYVVVINQEEQYSIWPAHRPPPDGWITCGGSSDKQMCLDRIAERWVDMRPRSLRIQSR